MQSKKTFRVALRALSLILTWYVMSTMLSLYNKKVIGRHYGVLQGTPFPLPMMMSALQFSLQHIFARTAHGLGCKRINRALLLLVCVYVSHKVASSASCTMELYPWPAFYAAHFLRGWLCSHPSSRVHRSCLPCQYGEV
jgi:hypothetical protein